MTSKDNRRPGTFWRPVFSDELGLRDTVTHRFGPEVFDVTRLWYGSPFHGDFPAQVQLYLDEAVLPVADYLANMLNWPIMSDRLVEHLWPMIHDCVQLFPAPLYEKGSDRRVTGWQVLNVTKVIDCVDVGRSTPWYHDGALAGFVSDEVCIDSTRTGGAGMFKYVIPPDGVETGVIWSYELVSSMVGKRFTGIGFIRCCCRGDADN